MTTLEIAINKIKKLPVEQRTEVIKFIEFLEFKVNESPRRKRTGYLNSFLPNILTPQSGGVFTLFVQ